MYDPPAAAAERAKFFEIKDAFSKLLIVQPAFAKFYRAHDEAVAGHMAVSTGDSQTLREAISRISGWGIDPRVGINPSSEEQQDAEEVIRPLLGLLPDTPAFKSRVETSSVFAAADGLLPIVESRWADFFPLPLKGLGEAPTLEQLFDHYCNNENPAQQLVVDRENAHGNKVSYRAARTTVEFLEPPPSLNFQIMRWDRPEPVLKWYHQHPALSWLFAPSPVETVKLMNPVKVPDDFSVTLKDGRVCHYKLASFVRHDGGTKGGHYTAGRIVNGNKYLLNDTNVTLAGPENEANWRAELGQSYLLCYLPAAPAPAALGPHPGR